MKINEEKAVDWVVRLTIPFVVGLLVFITLYDIIIDFNYVKSQEDYQLGWNLTRTPSKAEYECWKICDYGLYFYQAGNIFKQSICICKNEM